MAVKYVKEFDYPSEGGFHKSKMPSRAMPNAPARGAARMESKPKMGKGQGYAAGGRVPGREMDKLPAKKPPGRMMDLAPSKPERGQYQGYNKGGKVQKYSNGNVVRRGATRAAAMTPQASRAAAAASQAAGTNAYNRMLNNAFSQYMQNANLLNKAAAPSALRVAGKIASRAIPYAGTALLAKDAYDVAKDLYDQYQQSQQSGPTYNPEMEQPGLAKGGKVSKVMREYKAGKLHSGSKKGPVVKNPKQAVAIALSEARKAGAKIPKKAAGGQIPRQPAPRDPKPAKPATRAEGGMMSKGPSTRRSSESDRAQSRMEFAEKYAPGLSIDMPGRRVRKK